MRVDWTPRALAGFERQLDYFASFGGSAANRLALKMDAAMQTLRTFPRGGTKGRRYRIYAVPGTTLVLVYRVFTEHLEIAACVDGRQNWRKTEAS